MTKEMKLKCPICRKECAWEDNQARPFCSERCRLIDLGRWASGEYALPGEKASGPDEQEE
jgi:endogenous inhibitor of DNA gyrase (YacG/DUF329 family)